MKGTKSKPPLSTTSRRSAPPKNSTTTKRLLKPLALAVFFVGLWLLASYLFFRRFPNNYRQPNFFGEEGYVFAKNMIGHGFWHSLMTTFNGYYIWALYLLEKLAFTINTLFYGGQFAKLPRVFALVSYGFLGLMAILPLMLLRKYIKLPALVLIGLLTLYVPMRGWDYGIIGTLGNLKFACIYLAFLMLVYRHYLPEKSRQFYVVDIVLLVCAYTNVTVYVMLPFALVRYWPQLKGPGLIRNAKELLLSDRSAQSLVVLGLAMLPQLYIVKHDGIPKMPGYLDGPYNFRRTIEIFVARSYVYGILFTVYKHLNDPEVVATMLVCLAAGWRFAGKYRKLLVFGLVTIFAATFLFVIKRTGISEFYIGYHDPGPDQFFFAQNWVFDFIFVVVLVEIISKLKSAPYRLGVYGLLTAGFLIFMAPQTDSYSPTDFEAAAVGNIYAEGQKDCATKASSFKLQIYPPPNLYYTGVTRQQLCTPMVTGYRP
jgi:hypothetical protein